MKARFAFPYGRIVSAKTRRWGNPFRVLLDVDGNNQVKNPDAQNSDPNIAQPAGKHASEFLALDIAIYSCGQDGQPRTADDIVSWREP